jgi:hypothetical protein
MSQLDFVPTLCFTQFAWWIKFLIIRTHHEDHSKDTWDNCNWLKIEIYRLLKCFTSKGSVICNNYEY